MLLEQVLNSQPQLCFQKTEGVEVLSLQFLVLPSYWPDPEQYWTTSCLPWTWGLEAEGVLNDQHFPGSSLNFPLCLFILHVQLMKALWFGQQTCSCTETHALGFHFGPHFPVQSLYTRYMLYKWPSWTNLCKLISSRRRSVSATLYINFRFHFLILFCKYIWYLELEYTKCKYSSCICTNSDPFAV